jgi:Tol biopolymer transport system component
MQVWKMPSEGGQAVQVTRDGGMAAVESNDGNVYFSGQLNQKKGVWRVPIAGGQETLVGEAVDVWSNWDLSDRGVYYIGKNQGSPATLWFFDFAVRGVKTLARLSTDPVFAAGEPRLSPDGKWLVFSGGTRAADIMMIDNFR